MNENVELDCDPIGQSPIEIIWFERHSQQLTNVNANNNNNHKQLISNLTTIITPNGNINNNIKQQATTINQNAEVPSNIRMLSDNSFGRRLFMGTIRTNDEFNTNQPATPVLQASQTSQKLVELDSSMAFELIRNSNNNQQQELVRLLIKQVKRSHSADYICQAANRYGSDEKLIRLLVQEAPDPVTEVSFVRVESRSISLAWQAPYSGNLPITSYTIEWRPITMTQQQQQQQQHHSSSIVNGQIETETNEQSRWFEMTSQSASATIGSLQPKTSYQIRIRAHNSLGISPLPMQNSLLQSQSQLHTPFVHTTTEEAPSAPPSDVRAFPLSSSSIQVSWLPPIYLQQTDQQDHLNSYNNNNNKRIHKASITGYMIGYREANNTNATLIYKTISLLSNNELDSHSIHSDSTATATTTTMATSRNIQLPSNNSNLLGSTSSHLRVIVHDLKRNTGYAFHVQAINSAGPGPQSDPIEARTLLNDPPQAAQLRVSQSTYTSIELQWTFPTTIATPTQTSTDVSISMQTERQYSTAKLADEKLALQLELFNMPVDGYRLYYRLAIEPLNAVNSWTERHLTPETHALVQSGLADQRNEWSLVEVSILGQFGQSHDDPQSNNSIPLLASNRMANKQINWTNSNLNNKLSKSAWLDHASNGATMRYVLDQLSCGSSYQVYLIAYNSIGTGSPSQIVRAKTRGSSPIAPRKPKEFISVNSTSVLLNLEAWQDSGCAISNFEIRYRILRNGRNEIINDQKVSNTNRQQSATSWLLLSNNISPDQRQVELRDLEPETWYALLASGQSSSGKSEQEYRFMTLDKLGMLPAEAMEPPGSPFPAYFQATGPNNIANNTLTLRNLLTNFSSPVNQLSQSLLLCGSMVLVIFISCLVFQIRHRVLLGPSGSSSRPRTTTTTTTMSTTNGTNLNHDQHKDNASIDSTITGVTNYTSSDNSKNNNNNNGHLQSANCAIPFYRANATANGFSNVNNNKQFLLHRDSPYSKFDSIDQVNGQLFANLKQQIEHVDGQQQHQVNDHYGNSILDNILPQVTGDSLNQQQANQSVHKFNTLSRNELMQMSNGDQCNSHNNNRFRTMQHRPISTFTPPNATSARQFASFCNGNAKLNANNGTLLSNTDQQQQIYSKLRLLYSGGNDANNDSNNANFNLTPEHHNNYNGFINETGLVANSDNVNQENALLFQNHDSINLSQLSQRESTNNKNLTIREQLYNSLQQTNGESQPQQPLTSDLVESLILQQQNNQAQNNIGSNGNNDNNNNINDLGTNSEFASFLIDCQQYANTNQQANNNNNNNPSQFNEQMLNVATYGLTAPQSLSSGASTSNGSQSNNLIATPISQISSSINSSTNQQQLVDLQHQQAKLIMQTNNNNFANQQQQQVAQPATTNGLNNNEQSDYALPFPPKWV